MKITKMTTRRMAKKLNIDLGKIPLEQLYEGMKVELEHGTVHKKTDVTGDSLRDTTKIAWAHLNENKNYYSALKVMEKKLESNKSKSKETKKQSKN